MRYSKIIEIFLKAITEAETENQLNSEYMQEEDKYLQDILHKLELEETSIVEKIELATKLSESRKKRRKNKDVVETTGAIKEWINENKKSINSLKQLLGKVRKIEEYHENRTYTPKILN